MTVGRRRHLGSVKTSTDGCGLADRLPIGSLAEPAPWRLRHNTPHCSVPADKAFDLGTLKPIIGRQPGVDSRESWCPACPVRREPLMAHSNALLASLSPGDAAALRPRLKNLELKEKTRPVRERRHDPRRLLSDQRGDFTDRRFIYRGDDRSGDGRPRRCPWRRLGTGRKNIVKQGDGATAGSSAGL